MIKSDLFFILRQHYLWHCLGKADNADVHLNDMHLMHLKYDNACKILGSATSFVHRKSEEQVTWFPWPLELKSAWGLSECMHLPCCGPLPQEKNAFFIYYTVICKSLRPPLKFLSFRINSFLQLIWTRLMQVRYGLRCNEYLPASCLIALVGDWHAYCSFSIFQKNASKSVTFGCSTSENSNRTWRRIFWA